MVSSTIVDLPEHRQQVKDACLDQEMLPLTMEHQPASDFDPVAFCLDLVNRADVYVGVYAHRYGYVPDAHQISLTEMEYNRACERRIPRFIFIMHREHPIIREEVETGAAEVKLKAFKARVKKENVVKFFKSPVELRGQVISALSRVRPPEVVHALHQLPPPPADFTGREAELAELRQALEHGGVHISGLQGQGGVGKTALALKLAEAISPAYPDAQIYMDLRGASATPLTPAEALAYVIHAWHPKAKLPESVQELKPLYLSALSGKRALLLMDNARDAAQAAPLIPPAGCALLVTSRNRFTLPGLRPKDLDTLSPADAEKLLLEIEGRIGDEAANIAKLCGYLPLALRLAASALAERPNLSPAEYARRLERERLKLLASNTGDGVSVEASIGLSYGLLDAKTQKRWRMLGVFPETFDLPAAAAVWKVEASEAENVLGNLLQGSMVQWNEKVRRYHLHDLTRDFACARLAEAREAEDAARRHAAHYAEVLARADQLYRKGGERIKLGLALFDLEWGNVQTGQAWAADRAAKDEEAARLCSRYPDAGTYCLDLRQHPRERIRWREAALAAARRLKDRGGEGAHLGNLGLAYYSLGEYRRAIEFYEQDLVIAREIGHRQGEGIALGNLGNAYYSLGEYRPAIEYHEQCLAIAREIGDRRHKGAALGNLGNAYDNLGEHRRAIEFYEQDLVIAREIGHRQGEGQALGNLGIAYKKVGEYRRAIEYQEQHLAIAREIGDRQGEGNALWNMSLALDQLGERRKAIENAEAALKIFEQIEDPAAGKVRNRLEEWRGA